MKKFVMENFNVVIPFIFGVILPVVVLMILFSNK